jgi:hypothetical protein
MALEVVASLVNKLVERKRCNLGVRAIILVRNGCVRGHLRAWRAWLSAADAASSAIAAAVYSQQPVVIRICGTCTHVAFTEWHCGSVFVCVLRRRMPAGRRSGDRLPVHIAAMRAQLSLRVCTACCTTARVLCYSLLQGNCSGLRTTNATERN